MITPVFRLASALLVIMAVSMLISACTHRFYYPKPLAPALLSAPRQVRLNAAANLTLLNPIVALTVVGSPVNHLGIRAGIASAFYKETVIQNGVEKITYDERQSNPEVGIGYYKKLSPKILFETYSGWGVYKYANDAAAFVRRITHDDYFLQPSIAVIDGNTELAFTLRYDFLNRRSVLLDTASGSLADAAYSFLKYNNYSFLAPGFTLSVGGKRIKAQFQCSENFALNKNYETIYGSFGKTGSLKFAVGLLINVHAFF